MATSHRRKQGLSRSHAAVDPPISKRKERRPSAPLQSRLSSPDRFSLAHLSNVLTGGTRLDMLSAVDRLKGRSRVLAELALFSNFQYVRLAAVTHLRDEPETLLEIAKFCPFDDTRSSALDELSSHPSGLIEVACSSLFKDTRMDAVALLSNPAHLAQVASRSPNLDSRNESLSRISSDAPALKRVAEDSPYRKTRTDAIKRLKSRIDLLASLVLSSKHWDVRSLAASYLSESVEELDDVEALLTIALISKSQDSRYLAVGKLWRHPWALRRISFESKYKDSRDTALMLLSDLVSTLDDPDILADVAISSPYDDCRAVAIERLVGQSNALLSVASKSKYKGTRSEALERLKGDSESLKSVLKLSRYQDTRLQAHKMVCHPETFKAELSRILG